MCRSTRKRWSRASSTKTFAMRSRMADPDKLDAIVVTNLCVPTASGVPCACCLTRLTGCVVGIDVPGFGIPTHAEAKDSWRAPCSNTPARKWKRAGPGAHRRTRQPPDACAGWRDVPGGSNDHRQDAGAHGHCRRLNCSLPGTASYAAQGGSRSTRSTSPPSAPLRQGAGIDGPCRAGTMDWLANTGDQRCSWDRQVRNIRGAIKAWRHDRRTPTNAGEGLIGGAPADRKRMAEVPRGRGLPRSRGCRSGERSRLLEAISLSRRLHLPCAAAGAGPSPITLHLIPARPCRWPGRRLPQAVNAAVWMAHMKAFERWFPMAGDQKGAKPAAAAPRDYQQCWISGRHPAAEMIDALV